MKKYIPLSLLALSSIVLTGCSQSKLKAQYGEMVQEGKNKVAEVTNVKFHNKLSVNSYNYKEGEFYAYKMFALILIVPVSEQNYTWKENGEYWHYTSNSIGNKKTLTKIDEETFNSMMAAHKATITAELLNPLLKAEQLMDENQTEYKSVSNKFKNNMFNGQSSLQSTAVKEVVTSQDDCDAETGQCTTVVDNTTEETTKYTIALKKSLPVKYTVETDSEQTWTYTYGNAEFTVPDDVREMMNQQA